MGPPGPCLASRQALHLRPALGSAPNVFGGRGRGGQNTGRGEGRGARPLRAGSAGRAGRASGPLRAAPEEVPGPGGSGLFLVLRGSDCPCGCGKVLCPVPAQVPPAWSHGPGHSEPLAPGQRLLHACGTRGESGFAVILPTQLASSWAWGSATCLGAAPPQAWGFAEGDPKSQAGGGWGVLRLPGTWTVAKPGALNASPACGGPTAFLPQIWAKLQHPTHLYPLLPYLNPGRLPQRLWRGADG